MPEPYPRLRRLLVAHARTEAFTPHTRTILSKLGYAIVPAEQVSSLPAPLADQTPDLRIVDERRLEEVSSDFGAERVPMIVLTGRHGLSISDPRIVGVLPRPAGLHELYRLLQQALEETPRSTPRIATGLKALCRRNGKEWEASLLSISENGCLLSTPQPVPLGSHVDLVFELPDGTHIETLAESAYQMPPHLGFIFIETRASDRHAICNYVTSRLTEL